MRHLSNILGQMKSRLFFLKKKINFIWTAEKHFTIIYTRKLLILNQTRPIFTVFPLKLEFIVWNFYNSGNPGKCVGVISQGTSKNVIYMLHHILYLTSIIFNCYLQSKKTCVVFSTKLIHVCKKLPLALDCRQSKYSQQIYNIHIFHFWAWFLRFLSHVISKSSSFLL